MNIRVLRRILVVIMPAVAGIIIYLLNPDLFSGVCVGKGDYALISLYSERAKNFELFTGPYSRLGFQHPGPILFYLYAFGEWLFSFLQSIRGQHRLVQLLLNCFFLSLVYQVIKSKICKKDSVILFAILLFCIHFAHPRMLVAEWGPSVVIIPFFLCFISLVRVSLGEFKYLIYFSLGFVFASQNHIGTIPILIIFLLIATVLGMRQVDWNKEQFWRCSAVSVLVIGIFYLLPLYDVLANESLGNLGNIVRYFMNDSSVGQSIRGALAYLSSFYFVPIRPLGIFNKYAFITLLIVILCMGWRKYNIFEKRIFLLFLIGLLLSFISILNVSGKLYSHFMWYQYGLVAIAFFLVIKTICYYVKNHSIQRFISFGLIAVFLLLAGTKLVPYVFSNTNKECREFNQKVIEQIRPENHVVYKLIFQGSNQWQYAASLANQFYRDKISFCVDEDWTFMFGNRFSCNSLIEKNSKLKFKKILFTANKGQNTTFEKSIKLKHTNVYW